MDSTPKEERPSRPLKTYSKISGRNLDPIQSFFSPRLQTTEAPLEIVSSSPKTLAVKWCASAPETSSPKNDNQEILIIDDESPTKDNGMRRATLKEPPKKSPRLKMFIDELAPMNLRVLIYPNGGQDKDQVTITRNDLVCLEEGHMLNDNIVFFYLKYLTREDLGQEVIKQIHLFNTFFYPKLKQFKSASKMNDVGRWVKDVDIFSKDFLVIPVCDHMHWILLIVCYPGNVPGPNDPITITDEPGSLNVETDNPKVPAIIILDSLGRKGNYRLTYPVREFLGREFKERRQSSTQFNRAAMKDIWAKVPIQSNSYDCGVYILQYFEEFFKEPVKNYIRFFKDENRKGWFSEMTIQEKRKKIKKLISTRRMQLVSDKRNLSSPTCDNAKKE